MTPAATGALHADERAAEILRGMARMRRDAAAEAPQQAEYLNAFAARCDSLAERLEQSASSMRAGR